MLFRPSFCANCGEKIDRPEWFPWTSRRFCQVCAIEFKGYEMIPRAIVAFGIIIGLFGIGGYLRSGPAGSDLQVLKQPRKFVDQPAAKLSPADTRPSGLESANSAVPGQPEQPKISSTPGTTNSSLPAKSRPVVDEPMNYCGAETRKGTPCSRRVKGNTRCFQHIGMPVMVPSEKLSIK